MSIRAIVIEDDRSWQGLLSEILGDFGLEVDLASSLDEAIPLLRSNSHRVAVVDLSLVADDHNNQDGLRVLEAIHRLDPGCRPVLLTGFATVELAVSVLSDYNAFGFLRKESFNSASFKEIVRKALQSAPLASPVSSVADTPEPVPDFAKSAAQGRAILVDDDAGWRTILAELLEDEGYEVRICASFGEATGYLRREKFALAVVDLGLSGSNVFQPSGGGDELEGYQLLGSTRASGIPTLVVSGVASPEDIERTYETHAIFAYLEKQSFNRATFCKLVNEAGRKTSAPGELDVLTEREREVLDLLAQGLTNKEIAEKLVITLNTVKRHLKAIFEKLGVHTRAAATARAIGRGQADE